MKLNLKKEFFDKKIEEQNMEVGAGVPNFNLDISMNCHCRDNICNCINCFPENDNARNKRRLDFLLRKIHYGESGGMACASMDWFVDVYSLAPETLIEAIDNELKAEDELERKSRFKTKKQNE
jgi:hypothetical protein